MAGQGREENSDKGRERLPDRLGIPSNRLMVLLPVLGIASLVALGAVVVLGATMLEKLARQAESKPERLDKLTRQVEKLSDRIDSLELLQQELNERIARVDGLLSELYFARPATDDEKERAMLSKVPPAKLLELGLAALKQREGRPVPYFKAIMEEHPGSREAQPARLQLGMLWVRTGEYSSAVKLLEAYLDRPGGISTYDSARANYYLGMALSILERNDDAARHYLEALSAFPEQDFFRATGRLNLGEIYLKLGEKGKAAVQLEALIEEFGSNKRAVNMIKRARSILKSLRK